MVQDVCVGYTVPGQSTPLPIPTLTLYILNLVLVLYGPGSWLSLGAVLPILATIHHSLARVNHHHMILLVVPKYADNCIPLASLSAQRPMMHQYSLPWPISPATSMTDSAQCLSCHLDSSAHRLIVQRSSCLG